MHDPLVVAHTIVRPWPSRSGFSATGSRGDGTRWKIRHYHACTDYCRANDPPHRPGAFPWWKPRSYSRFWRVAGTDLYWPPLVTIWHREPGGADALSACQRRYQDKHGKWRYSKGWRWHVHHWHVKVEPFTTWRRRLLTRCAWCGGRSRKHDAVNVSFSWDGPAGRWWQGEPGLYHRDCSGIAAARVQCACTDPAPAHGTYGRCLHCGRHVPHGRTAAQLARVQELAQLADGARPGR